MSVLQKKSIKLYRHPLSGHSHRVELFLSLRQIPYENIDIDLRAGAHKQPEFLAKNPLGQVPVIEDGDFRLADSNAILVYLATQYGNDQWYPTDPKSLGKVQRWLSFAAGPVANGPAAARRMNIFRAPAIPGAAAGVDLDHEKAKAIANALFNVIEAELSRTPFTIGERATIADVAAYGFIARAPEGDVDLHPYPHIRSWLRRIEGLPHFIPLKVTPVGLEKAT